MASLLGQRPQPPRVVVVDDGSTDPATVAVLDRLSGEVEVLRLQNCGVAASRNAGAARADTPFLLFLDADDRLAPGALNRLREALAANRSAGFAYGDQRFFGDWEGEMRFPSFFPLRLLDRHLIGPTALMRSELWQDTGGYDPAFALYEDWEIWLAALASGWHGVHLDEVTHEYRQHGTSKLSTDRRLYRDFRRQVMVKHADLYADRDGLAAYSDMRPPQRLLYRFFWGPRPLPAAVESWAARLLLSTSSG